MHVKFFLMPVLRWFRHPSIFHEWSFFPLQVGMIFLAIACVYVLAKKRQCTLAIYLAGSIVLPLSGGLFGSFTRFMMVSFPLVVVLAEFGENRYVDQAIRLASAALLTLFTLACALKFGLGMA